MFLYYKSMLPAHTSSVSIFGKVIKLPPLIKDTGKLIFHPHCYSSATENHSKAFPSAVLVPHHQSSSRAGVQKKKVLVKNSKRKNTESDDDEHVVKRKRN